MSLNELCKKRTEINLVDGSTKDLVGKMIIYTLPIVLVGLLQLLYSAFDLIVVQGHDGNLAAAAVGANNSLISLITSGFLGLTNGVNVVISRTYGKNERESCSRALHTSLVLSLIGGVLIGLLGYIFSKYFLEWMKVDVSYIDLADVYLKIYFIGLPFLSLYNFGTAILRGVGNSFTPLLFLIISGITNVILNYTFVYAFNMGVSGVAWATVISEGLSAFLTIGYLYLNKGFIRFRFKELKISKDELLTILRIGLPSGIQGIVFSISNVLLQTSVNTWGADVVAANSDASSIEGFTYISMFAVSSTSSAFISANYGRGFKENIKKIILTTSIMVICIGLLFGGIELLFHRELLEFYMGENVDREVENYAVERLIVILSTYWLCGLMDTECGTLRGLGYSISPLIITLSSCCLFRVFWNAYIYSSEVGNQMHSLGVLYMCYPISWLIAFAAELVMIFALKKRYEKRIDENLVLYNKKHGMD